MSFLVGNNPPIFLTYQQASFLDLIERIYDLERMRLMEDVEGDALPVFFHSRKILRRKGGFMLPFQFYATPNLRTPEEVTLFFDAFKDWSRRTGDNLTFSSLEEYAVGQSIVVANNPILSIPADVQTLETGFSRNLRNNLKRNSNKAHRMGIKIFESCQVSDMQAFYRGILAPQYVKKHRMLFHPYALFHSLLELGMARLIVAKNEERIIGGLVLIDDVDGVHYAWGASESPHQVAVGTLMLRFALEDATMRRRSWFDFGSTPLSDDELYTFKMRWGCTNFRVRRYYSLRAPYQIDLNASFSLPRHLFSFLPPSWACELMPKVIPWLVS